MVGPEQSTHGSNDPGFSSRPPPEIHPHQKGGGGEFFALYGPNWIRDRDGWSNAVQVTAQHRDQKGRTDFPTAKYAQTLNSNEGGQGLAKGESGGIVGGEGERDKQIEAIMISAMQWNLVVSKILIKENASFGELEYIARNTN